MHTPKETNHKRDTNRYTFSFASDIQVEKLYILFSCRVKTREFHEHIF